MTPLETCLTYLDNRGIRYSYIQEALGLRAGAAALPGNIIAAETIVLKADAKYLLVVVPAEAHVEIGKVRSMVDAKIVRFATAEETESLFSFGNVDHVPPFGALAGATVYLDSEIASRDSFVFSICTSHDLIHIRTEDFVLMARTVVGSLSMTDYQKEFRNRLATAKAAGA